MRIGIAVKPGLVEARATLVELEDWLRTRGAAAMRLVMVAAIVLNAAAIVLTTVKSLHSAYGGWFDAMDDVAVLLFALDYGARIWTAPEDDPAIVRTPWSARLAYMGSALGIVDLVAMLPLLLAFFVRSDSDWFRVLRLGASPVGALALTGGSFRSLMATAIASLVAVALERGHSFDRQCLAEAARQSARRL